MVFLKGILAGSWTMGCVPRNLQVWTLIVVFVCFLKELEALKNVRATVPMAARVGDSVTFQCQYDLEGDALYTVKWYKGIKEFFRYIPKEDPRMQIFPLPGVHVDLSRSSSTEVVLLDVEPEATGTYKCEVSTDAPYFYTVWVSKYMHVLDVPDAAPLLELSKKSNNEVGGWITANCTTPPSSPPMNVTWYINGIKVREHDRKLVSLDPLLVHSKSPTKTPYMTVSYLKKEIDDNTYQGGSIRVQCIATLFDLYKSENVRYIEDSRPQSWLSSAITKAQNSAGSFRLSTITISMRFLVTAIVIIFLSYTCFQ